MIVDGIDMLPGAAEYPRNQWYVIAWSHEVEVGKMLARECCDDPVLLYRDDTGRPIALFNRCPHRGMMLTSATGRIVDNTVQCGYHGIRFDGRGKCVEVPSGGTCPTKMCVRSYPLIEKWKWLWIWMGDPALADEALIPDHRYLGLEDSEMFSEPGLRLEVKANYLLPLENLVDATHITFLHHGLIDSGNVATHPYKVVVDGSRLSSVRVFENETLPPMLRAAMGIKGERVNRTLTLTAFSNNLCEIRQNFEEIDIPGAQPARLNLIVSVTPCHATLTQHFALFCGSFENRHPGRFEDLRNLLMEDVVVIEEIQLLFNRLGRERAPEVSVAADDVNIRARRSIAAMILRERELSASAGQASAV
ncbi:Rieske 2Fe-2S domain-containing protein [Paraburkholderia fungorum]